MDKELKAKWVAALRSKKFKQGTKQMVTKAKGGNRFCCLGVLAKVEGIPLKEIRSCNKDLRVAGSAVMSGLTDAQLLSLTWRNDGVQAFSKNPQNFRQIADYIEANF